MAAALSANMPEPRPSVEALLLAGAALQALLEQQPPPACSPSAIFGPAFAPSLSSLPAPALSALLRVCHFAALPAALTATVTACLAQRYASLPPSALEAEIAGPSPSSAALLRQWWAEHLGPRPAAPTLAAWLESSQPYGAGSLPPLALGLSPEAPPEEHWARGLDCSSSSPNPPPLHAALLALAFGHTAFLQRHFPCLPAQPRPLQLLQPLEAVALLLAAPAPSASSAMLACGALWRAAGDSLASLEACATAGATSAALAALTAHWACAATALPACAVLAALLRHQEEVHALPPAAAAAAVATLLAALRTHSSSSSSSSLAVCSAAARALARLAMWGEGGGGQQGLRHPASAARQLLAVLQAHPGSARLAAAVCEALQQLSGCPAGAEACTAAGVPAAVVGVLAQHPGAGPVATAACLALQFLSIWGPHEQGACTVAGALPAVAGVLQAAAAAADGGPAAEAAASVLYAVAALSRSLAALLAAGAAPAAAAALRAHGGSYTVVRFCCAVLSALAGGSREGEDACSSAGALAAVLHTLSQHWRERASAECCCSAAQVLTEGGGREVAGGGAGELLLRTLQEHSHRQSLVLAARRALANLGLEGGRVRAELEQVYYNAVLPKKLPPPRSLALASLGP
jgi:hypothetical protein